jgi:mono/diheme cytochrome c family protein
MLIVWCALPTVGRSAPVDATEEESPTTAPGLIATYSAGTKPETAFTRYEASPTFLLAPGETPDPRLPVAGWNVRWEGLLRVSRPGKYHFSASHSGPLVIAVAGQQVLDEPTGREQAGEGMAVNLPFGPAPITITFSSPTPGAALKVFWQSEATVREPLSPRSLAHTISTPALADSFTAGRLTVEEHNCVLCHRPSAAVKISSALESRPGPRLTDAGARLKVGWIFHWLDNPQQLRAEAVMPRLFTPDKQGMLERYAVAVYLASHGSLPDENKEPPSEATLNEGHRLFNQTGCAVCHQPHGKSPARSTLAGLGSKTAAAALAEYLVNPAASDPAGRMPNMRLSPSEADSLARYLVHRDEKRTPSLGLPQMPSRSQWGDLLHDTKPSGSGDEESADSALESAGQTTGERLAGLALRVMQEKRCAACHEFTPPKEKQPLAAVAAKNNFAAIAAALTTNPAAGCMAPNSGGCDGRVPAFGTSLNRAAAASFLKQAPAAPGTSAPGQFAELTIQRFGCLGCHRRNAEGGLAPDVLSLLSENQTPEGAELVSPPPLTGVIEKLRADYLNAVLFEGKRSRPWMTLRMPEFSKPRIAALPAALAVLDGDRLDNTSTAGGSLSREAAPESDKQLDEAGRRLVGSRGFGCTKCHDMLGTVSTGTRGPDLAKVAERVHFAWYDRWMIDPQKIQPGTRMPTVFLNGKSPYVDVLGGDAAQQRLAIWHYLSHAKDFPPPEGLEPPKPAEIAVVSDGEYQTLRTFLPEVTPRSMAVRGPGGVSFAYDLQACRLAYAWSGDFVDTTPVWDGRGGQPARIKGPVFWHSPAGFPWDVTSSLNSVPDFATHAADTALGAALPQDGKLHPTRLDFRGYRLIDGDPQFRYEFHLEGDQSATFAEQIIAIPASPSAAASGTLRKAEISAPAERTVWLEAALSEEAPRWTAPDGSSGVLDTPDKTAPADAVLQAKQEGKPVVLHLRAAPPGVAWVAARQNGKYAVLLRFSAAAQPAPTRVSLAVLSPSGDATAVQTTELRAK